LQFDVPFEAVSPTKDSVAGPQLSLAITPPGFGGGTSEKHWTLWFAGHWIEGGVVSLTVKVCVHVAVRPQAFITW
jgi:hypothetical protein